MVLFVAQGVEVERVEWFEAEDEALNKEMYLTGIIMISSRLASITNLVYTLEK